MEPTAAVGAEEYESHSVDSDVHAVHEVRASLLSTVRDRCIECGVPLAADQRYCLECGERNGDPRVPMLERRAAAQPPAAKPRRIHLTPNASLLAGIAILLLAMGTGVLIGRSGDGTGSKAASPQIITVPTAAAAGTTTGAAATTSSETSSKASKKSSKKHAKKGIPIKVEGTTGKVKIPKAVVKVGETKGTGPGYDKKTHKFTGDFFGQ